MTAYLFEFKNADSGEELEGKAKDALAQIEEKKYDQEPLKDGYKKIVKYGVAFYGKDCFVVTKNSASAG